MKGEPEVIINGELLSDAQAMTLRVAIEGFIAEMKPGCLGDDEHGKLMQSAYKLIALEIRDLIFKEKPIRRRNKRRRP